MEKSSKNKWVNEQVDRLWKKSAEGYLHVYFHPNNMPDHRYLACILEISATESGRIRARIVVYNNMSTKNMTPEQKWGIQSILKTASEKSIDPTSPRDGLSVIDCISDNYVRLNPLSLHCSHYDIHGSTYRPYYYVSIREVDVPSPAYKDLCNK